MPLLNFFPVLTSPLLLDTFSVIRRAEVVGDNGRAALTEVQTDGVYGVVTQSTPEGSEHADDATRAPRSLDVVTSYHLRAPSEGFQGDVILWAGDHYTVTSCQPYQNYAPGFFEVQATLTKPTAQPL